LKRFKIDRCIGWCLKPSKCIMYRSVYSHKLYKKFKIKNYIIFCKRPLQNYSQVEIRSHFKGYIRTPALTIVKKKYSTVICLHIILTLRLLYCNDVRPNMSSIVVYNHMHGNVQGINLLSLFDCEIFRRIMKW